MSDGFSIPAETTLLIEELFPESDERRKIAFTLMHWNRKPNVSEIEEIATSVSRGTSTVYKVMQKLMDAGIFTSDHGSVPLYRYSEEIRHKLLMGVEPEGSDIRELHESLESVTNPIEEDEKFTTELEVVNPIGTVVPPVSPNLEAQVSLQDAEIKNIKTTIDSRFSKIEEMIAGLSVTPPDGNPRENPMLPPVTQTNPAVPQGQLSMEDRLAELEQRVQSSEGSTDPFENLNREQIIELIRSQPAETFAMVNPDAANLGGRVQATNVTLRPLIIMFTTYTQMLYEKALHDGYFDGTLSDFVQFTIEQYFVDRGYSLDFTKHEPANLRRRLG